jgi:hypothetical protein
MTWWSAGTAGASALGAAWANRGEASTSAPGSSSPAVSGRTSGRAGDRRSPFASGVTLQHRKGHGSAPRTGGNRVTARMRGVGATGVAMVLLGALASGAQARQHHPKPHCKRHAVGRHDRFTKARTRPNRAPCAPPPTATSPPPPPPGANGPGTHAPSSASSVPPSIALATESHRSWREGNALARLSSAGPPVGTTFSLALNENATVSFVFTQWVRGREVKRRCVAETAKNARLPACRRAVPKGALELTGHAGNDRVLFDGRISRSQRLQPGVYTVTVTAANAERQRSTPRRLGFVILK